MVIDERRCRWCVRSMAAEEELAKEKEKEKRMAIEERIRRWEEEVAWLRRQPAQASSTHGASVARIFS